jgi:hypothetical protein
MSTELNILNHPDRCRFLLSKGLFINAGMPSGEEASGDGNFWCGKTQRVTGPDRELCDPEFCLNRDRGCYEALV